MVRPQPQMVLMYIVVGMTGKGWFVSENWDPKHGGVGERVSTNPKQIAAVSHLQVLACQI